MNTLNKYLKVAAVCSILGAITTAILVILKAPTVVSVEDKTQLVHNSAYMLRLWLFFIHPQLNLLAAIGIGLIYFKKYPEYIIPAILFITIWAVTESAQQAFNINAVNLMWRTAYETETNPAIKNALFANLYGSDAIKDSMYFLLLISYGIGSFLIGIPLFTSNLFGKIIGGCFVFYGVLSIIYFLGNYMGLTWVIKPVDFVFDYIYPWMQSLARFSLGVWLWRFTIKSNHSKHKIET